MTANSPNQNQGSGIQGIHIFIIALVAICMVGGSILLAVAEGGGADAAPTAPFFPTNTLPSFPTNTLPPAQSPAVTQPPSDTPAPTATLIPFTALPNCPAPDGWLPYAIQVSDSVNSLAASHNTTAQNITTANCLQSNVLVPGDIIFLPPLPPTATLLPIVYCGPPPGWVRTYLIQPGDNLYRIGLAYGVSVTALQNANCLGNSTYIVAGDYLWVPPWATVTPIPTNTDIPH